MAKTIYIVPLLLLLLFGCGNSADPLPEIETPTAIVSPTPTMMLTASPTQPPTPIPTPEISPTPAFLLDEGIVVSEVFVGTSQAFVELYNPGAEPVDLNGHVLMYQQSPDHVEVTLHAWDSPAFVPPHGHYLLVQENASVGVLPDVTFEALLSAESGGLILKNGTIAIEESAFAWGANPPESFLRGEPAPAPNSTSSLERLPGGDAGNGRDSGDTASDVVERREPAPQNSGSLAVPGFEQGLTISLELPESVVSGSEFGYFVRISNQTGETLENVTVSIPFSDEFTTTIQPASAEQANGRLVWTIDMLIADASITEPIYVQAPFTTDDLLLNGGFVSAENFPPAFANVAELKIEGGTIPIAAARGQVEQVVTVAGVATVNTSGLFVPEEGQLFYLEDATGGIRVFVPKVSGRASVAIGDEIRVVGTVRKHRGTIEIVPSTAAVNVSRLGRASVPVSPVELAIADVTASGDLIGRLVTIGGVATRVEAFPHWYELVLRDDDGESVLVRIDRVSDISATPLTTGQRFQVFGVLDFVENDWVIKPRVQSDIVALEAPELLVDYVSPSSIADGGVATHVLTISNNGPDPLRNVIVAAAIPLLPNAVRAGEATNPSGNGQVAGDGKIYWGIAQLDPGGSTEVLTFDMEYAGQGEAQASVQVSAETLPEPIIQLNRIFVGQNVPINAIQGPGDRSPYDGQTVTTNGIVTAVFPDLKGFWLQSNAPDEDPLTSEGLFVKLATFDESLDYGDAVQVRGVVEERRGETTLVVDASGSVDALRRTTDFEALEPIVLDPPIDPDEVAAYFEPLEGMRVAIREPAVVVAPTNADGETVLVLRKRRVSEVPFSDNPPGYTIVLDDGRSSLATDLTDDALIFQKGDQLRRIVGVLAYTNDQYKIEPFSAEPYDLGITRIDEPLPTIETDGQIAFATFNTGGLFDRLQPHPSDIEMDTRERFVSRLDQLADAIVRMDAPAVVALQSVETLQVLEGLVQLDAIAEYQYTPFLIKGSDPRGYNNAFLVREKVLPVTSVTQLSAPTGLTRRPVLMLETMLNGVPLLVLNVHYVSAESGESTTLNSRLVQSAWLVEAVEQLRSDNTTAEIVVLGNFGSDWQSPVMEGLISAELTHPFSMLDDDAALPYTVITNGYTAAPDHILLSQDLVARFGAVQSLHVNADFPIIDRNNPDAPKLSNHDPLVVTLLNTVDDE